MTELPPSPGTTAPAVAKSRARWWFRGTALLLAAGAFALYAVAPTPETQAGAGDEAAAVPVRVLELEARLLERTTRLSGVIEPRRRVELFSETTGRVIALGAEKLDSVDADQMLVEVDPLLAEVAVERAAASIARAASQLALARGERERYEKLAGRDAASASRLDQAVNAEKVASANLREGRAALLEAKDGREKTAIRAPFAGVLQSFDVEAGEFLRMGDRIAELLDVTTVLIELGVTDREIVDVSKGASVSVAIEAYPGEVFDGSILRIGAAADMRSRKFPVEIELPNPGLRILPGMIAQVRLNLGDASPLRAIPRDAVVDRFGVRFVYVVAREGGRDVARRRRIEVRNISFLPGFVELVEGVEDGEFLATAGMSDLRDGVQVSVSREAVARAGAAP
jgi:membrane fusion protein (multidrug efflux system)